MRGGNPPFLILSLPIIPSTLEFFYQYLSLLQDRNIPLLLYEPSHYDKPFLCLPFQMAETFLLRSMVSVPPYDVEVISSPQ